MTATPTAEIVLPCAELEPTLAFFLRLGFQVETIFPAEQPTVASLSGHGLRLRLEPGAGDPGRIRLAAAEAGPTLTAPNGTRIAQVALDPSLDLAALRPEFVITRRATSPDGGAGRAGMLYRDLIPGRLGGRYIASHIAIPEGGPVSDWPHFHRIRFQMIFVRQGWVRVVYEDQGEPFVMQAGDCVLQPPLIRHRVLESSRGLEVVEIGCPALHETLADHQMTLPTGGVLPDRDFGGQRFAMHVAAKAPWTAWGEGFERQDTMLRQATGGIGDVRVTRAAGGSAFQAPVEDAELRFGFVLEGSAVLNHDGAHALGPSDAFVIPPGAAWGLSRCSPDLKLLEVLCSADGLPVRA